MKKKLKIASFLHSLDSRDGGIPRAVIDQNLYFIYNKKYSATIINLDDNTKIPKGIKKIKYISLHKSIFKSLKFFGLNRFNVNIDLFFWLLKNKNNYNVFIFHGLWDFKNILARIILKKNYYIFVHGALDPYEKKTLFKYLKKKVYWFLVEKKNLLNAKKVLLTTISEKELAKKTFVNTEGIKFEVTNYGIFSLKNKQDLATNVFNKKFPFLRNKKYYLFLGRIDEKKGLDIAVQSINLLGDNFKGLFVIFGDYKNSCGLKIEKLIKKLKLENKILLLGHLEYYLKNIVITNSKAMILSSHAENFAISLVESLSCARPVLTTYKVNIFNKILNYKAGYVSQKNPISFSKIISKFEALNSKEKLQMSINASKCFNNEFNLANKKYFIPSLENNLNE
jgi:glycosyltransferase involved in cell wall biosynthesis